MSSRLILKDMAKNRVVTLAILLFVSAAATLLALSAMLGVSLFGSIDKLMRDAKTPHFMQMHTGEPDMEALKAFAAEDAGVTQFQVLNFLNIGSDFIAVNGETLAGTLQDNGFCTQSGQFDFLLDLNQRPVQPAAGEVYAPVFYGKDGTIEPGDIVSIHGVKLKVAGFVRDSQMNSPLAYSKRFVVSEADYARLEPLGAVEYLIEFRLHDLSDLGRFSAAYSAAGLPAAGPTLTWPLFRMVSALSDGIMIAVILLASILVVLIALLCIRFALLAKIEEDYREIGLMRALGMRVSEIRGLYLLSYGTLAALGSALGLALALLVQGPMAAGIRLSLGGGHQGAPPFLLGLAGVLLLLLCILLYVGLMLRRLRGVSAAQALRFGMAGREAERENPLKLSQSKGMPVNLFLGVQDVWARKRLYATMLAVVMLAAFLIIVPQNLYRTISSESFVTYMGIGRCDLRMDLRQDGRAEADAAEIAAYMQADEGIARYTVLTTKTLGIKRGDGTVENMKVELGDHSVFPVQCVSGRMPLSEQEIALSALSAQDLGKAVGDQIILLSAAGEKALTISGIYSDITNGGKTAKAVFALDSARAAWSVVCASLAGPALLDGKKAEYAARFGFAKVSGIADYVAQTFGQTLRSVRLASLVSILAAAVITLLVSLLFLGLLVAKDRYAIAVMKAMGFSNRDVRRQYMWRLLSVAAAGIALGTLLAGTLGEKLAALAISSFGAAAFRFVVDIPATYLFCPAVLCLAALIAVSAGASAIRDIRVCESIKE